MFQSQLCLIFEIKLLKISDTYPYIAGFQSICDIQAMLYQPAKVVSPSYSLFQNPYDHSVLCYTILLVQPLCERCKNGHDFITGIQFSLKIVHIDLYGSSLSQFHKEQWTQIRRRLTVGRNGCILIFSPTYEMALSFSLQGKLVTYWLFAKIAVKIFDLSLRQKICIWHNPKTPDGRAIPLFSQTKYTLTQFVLIRFNLLHDTNIYISGTSLGFHRTGVRFFKVGIFFLLKEMYTICTFLNFFHQFFNGFYGLYGNFILRTGVQYPLLKTDRWTRSNDGPSFVCVT